jgi:hypothetical protein
MASICSCHILSKQPLLLGCQPLAEGSIMSQRRSLASEYERLRHWMTIIDPVNQSLQSKKSSIYFILVELFL